MGDKDYEELTSVSAPTAMGGGNRPRIYIASTDGLDRKTPLDNSPAILLPWTLPRKCSHRTSKNTQRELCAIALLIRL